MKCKEQGKDVLIVVDYQKDFVTGALGFDSAPSLDKGIASLVEQYAKKENGFVFMTFDTHYDDYLETQEGKKLPVPHCIQGTDGWKLHGETEMAEIMYPLKCTRIEKNTFGSDELLTKLRYMNSHPADRDAFNEGRDYTFIHNNVKSITLVGVVTNMCVISNAVIAKTACPNAEINIVGDLCDSFDKELHQKALDVMESMQMNVIKYNDIKHR